MSSAFGYTNLYLLRIFSIFIVFPGAGFFGFPLPPFEGGSSSSSSSATLFGRTTGKVSMLNSVLPSVFRSPRDMSLLIWLFHLKKTRTAWKIRLVLWTSNNDPPPFRKAKIFKHKKDAHSNVRILSHKRRILAHKEDPCSEGGSLLTRRILAHKEDPCSQRGSSTQKKDPRKLLQEGSLLRIWILTHKEDPRKKRRIIRFLTHKIVNSQKWSLITKRIFTHKVILAFKKDPRLQEIILAFKKDPPVQKGSSRTKRILPYKKNPRLQKGSLCTIRIFAFKKDPHTQSKPSTAASPLSIVLNTRKNPFSKSWANNSLIGSAILSIKVGMQPYSNIYIKTYLSRMLVCA